MKAAASLRQRVSLSSLLTYSKEDVLTVVEQVGAGLLSSLMVTHRDSECCRILSRKYYLELSFASFWFYIK